MQSASSRFWTRVTVSISYDDNHYTTGISNERYRAAGVRTHLLRGCNPTLKLLSHTHQELMKKIIIKFKNFLGKFIFLKFQRILLKLTQLGRLFNSINPIETSFF